MSRAIAPTVTLKKCLRDCSQSCAAFLFKPLVGVYILDETPPLVFDILHTVHAKATSHGTLKSVIMSASHFISF